MVIVLYLGLVLTMIPSCQLKKINDEITLQNLSLILDNSEFKGTWWTYSNQKQFNFLTVSQGTSYLTFGMNQQQLFSQLQIQFMNPYYQQNRNIILQMDLNNYDPLLSQWQGNSSINYTEHNMFKSLHSLTHSCQVLYTVRVDFQQSNNPCKCYDKLQNRLALNKPRFMQLQTMTIAQFKQRLNFFQRSLATNSRSWYIACFQVCQVFTNSPVLRYFTYTYKVHRKNPVGLLNTSLFKFSLMSMAYLTIFDGYICFLNINLALANKNYFYHFMIPALFYLLLSTPCDIRLLQVIWRSKIRNMNHLEQNRALTLFFIQLYSCMMIYFILSQMLELELLFGLVSALYFVPQIVLNAFQGKSPKYQSGSLYGLLVPSLLITLYFKCCPSNVRGLEPSNSFIIIWISLYLSQVSLLIIQYLFGSRFFVPRCLIPKKYDYFRSIKYESITEDQCAICLQQLYSNNEEGNDQPFLSLKLMVAPCNHIFHQDCLSYWMQIKLQCPTCRQILPSLE